MITSGKLLAESQVSTATGEEPKLEARMLKVDNDSATLIEL